MFCSVLFIVLFCLLRGCGHEGGGGLDGEQVTVLYQAFIEMESDRLSVNGGGAQIQLRSQQSVGNQFNKC